MDVSHLLDGLNAAQREAVSAPLGHHLILAGAGSGKTRVLIHRIAWLTEVCGVPAHGIFAVTFTNKAAGEMRHRIDLQLSKGSRGMWIGTFHGLAHRLLRLHWADAKLPEAFQVMDSDDQLRMVKRVVQQLELDDSKYPPKQVMWWINTQKDEGRRPQHIQPEPHDQWGETLRQAYAAYQERCDRAGLVDFAELLLRAHELLRDNPALLSHYRARFREILVDEFQDTNAIQYAFVRVLAGDSGHVFVVGDDDQAEQFYTGQRPRCPLAGSPLGGLQTTGVRPRHQDHPLADRPARPPAANSVFTTGHCRRKGGDPGAAVTAQPPPPGRGLRIPNGETNRRSVNPTRLGLDVRTQ